MWEIRDLNHLKIPFQFIQRCTEDFNTKNIIGGGGYGEVYSGYLSWASHENRRVAVKQPHPTSASGQGNKEFYTEVTMLSRCRHKNIITLIGFCDDNNEMIIVYEYASHRSLDRYLGKPAMLDVLPWRQRLQICIGVASALEYLHNYVQTDQSMIHRDIKSGNILLDDNQNAKLSDFGLSRMCPANQRDTPPVITNPVGTRGYVDPQYAKTEIMTKEVDVYSFGVVLFELLCGRREIVSNYNYFNNNDGNEEYVRDLVDLARWHYESGTLDKIIDDRVKRHIKRRVLRKVSRLAYQCLQETREKRPAIDEVLVQLKEASKIQVKRKGKVCHVLP